MSHSISSKTEVNRSAHVDCFTADLESLSSDFIKKTYVLTVPEPNVCLTSKIKHCQQEVFSENPGFWINSECQRSENMGSALQIYS